MKCLRCQKSLDNEVTMWYINTYLEKGMVCNDCITKDYKEEINEDRSDKI